MVYLPSAFTPDGDGTNDVFRPVGAGLTVWKLSVFDRFGTSIYEGDQFAGGWNGNNLNKQPVDGLFVLKLDYLEPDSGKEKTVFGKIFVQR